MRLRRTTLAAAATAAVAALVAAPAVSAQDQGIPSDASSQCQAYINVFNHNTDFSQCTDPLLSAVTQYTKATSQKGATPVSDANALTTALDALCTNGAGCSASTMKGIVRTFASDCLHDLVAPREDVVSLYDKLYLITPFQNALCAKDDNNKYCVTTLAESGQVGNETKRSLPEQETEYERLARGVDELTELNAELQARAGSDSLQTWDVSDKSDSSAEIIIENSEGEEVASSADNLPFLFIQPNSPKSILCGTCAQKILAAYINFETSIPYAIGLANSGILKTQSPLYKAGQSTCGDSWAKQVNALANTSAFAEVSPAARSQPYTAALLGSLLATLALVTAF